MLRSTLLATAALALAAPAHAATLELRAGPVTLAPNQIARTLTTNAGTSLCRTRLTIQHNHVQEDGSVSPGRTPDNTVVSQPGGGGLVDFCDPNIIPGVVAELAQAQAVVGCRSLTLAQTRAAVGLTLELAPTRFAPPQVVMQGTE